MPAPRGPKTKRSAAIATSDAAAAGGIRRADALATVVTPETKTVMEAILVGGQGWRRRNRRPPTFGDEHDTFVSMGEPTEELSAADEEHAWQQVLKFDDETAITFLYAMSRFLADNTEPESLHPVTIHVNELLEYKGHSRQSGGDFKPAAKHAERRRFAMLAAAYITRRIGRVRRLASYETSQVMVVVTRSEADGGQSPLPYVEEPTIGIPYEFEVQPGAWGKAALSAERRLMLTIILRLDPGNRVQRMAMRLGLYLHFKPSSEVTVRELLDGAYIEKPQHHMERFRDEFEGALDRLQQDQLIGPWSYVDEAELPARKWLDDWLQWRLSIRETPTRIVASNSQALPRSK